MADKKIIKRKLEFDSFAQPSKKIALSEDKSTQKNRKRKRNLENRNYRLGEERRGQNNSKKKNGYQHDYILRLRADNTKTFVDKNNRTQKLKTSALYNFKNFKTKANKKKVTSLLSKQLEKIDTHRPIAKIVERNKNGSPIKVETPTKRTKLTLRSDYKTTKLFDNRSPIKRTPRVTTIKPNNKFFTTNAYKAMYRSNMKRKQQQLTSTAKHRKQIKKEKIQNDNRRITSQSDVMKNPGFKAQDATAKKYMDAAAQSNPFPNIPSELNHLINYASGGEKTQIPENIYIAGVYCNTNQLILELLDEDLNIAFDTYQKIVGVDLIEGTEIGKKTDYNIITKSFEFPHEFDCYDEVQPHYNNFLYARAMLRSLIGASEETRNSKTNKKQSFYARFFSDENENLNQPAKTKSNKKKSNYIFFFEKESEQSKSDSAKLKNTVKKKLKK